MPAAWHQARDPAWHDARQGGDVAAVDRGKSEYLALLDRVRTDPTVVGVVLTGSRGRKAFVRDDSDWDVRIFVDDGLADAKARFDTTHGSAVEAVVFSIDAIAQLADPTSSAAWDRYSYAHATCAYDRSGGGFEATIAALETLLPDTALATAADALDGYINAYYRSLKNARAGLVVESLLDAGESIAPLLTTLFAMHERVRPFNKFLGWELETHPLPDMPWLASDLLPRLRAIQATGDVAAQSALFRDVEGLARQAAHGDTIDSWEPDVPWLRTGVSRAGRAGAPGTRGSPAS
jgi:hypothetical protein